MPRNGAGTFAVSYPIIVGRTRSSSEVNDNFEDMGDELTNTLPINGDVGMDSDAQFKAANGTLVQPGIAFASDNNTGFRRRSADSMAWVAGGVDRAYNSASQMFFLGAMDVVGAFTVNGALTGDADMPAIEALTGNGLSKRTAANTWSLDDGTSHIFVERQGNSTLLPPGVFADIRVPFAATIVGVTLLADVAGDAVVDIFKDTLANYPPTAADSICGSNKPTLDGARTYEDTSVTGWTTAIAAGDCLRFNIDSVNTITWLQVLIKIKRFT